MDSDDGCLCNLGGARQHLPCLLPVLINSRFLNSWRKLNSPLALFSDHYGVGIGTGQNCSASSSSLVASSSDSLDHSLGASFHLSDHIRVVVVLPRGRWFVFLSRKFRTFLADYPVYKLFLSLLETPDAVGRLAEPCQV